MRIATARPRLARMFRRSHKAPASGQVVEVCRRAEVGDIAGLRAEHLKEWRDASKTVTGTYRAWCAAARPDRRDLYLCFLDALRQEERAALQVERDALALGAADPNA